MQKVFGAFIYVLCLEQTLWVFSKMLLAKWKNLALSFGDDSGILMTDSGNSGNKFREYLWNNFAWVLCEDASFFYYQSWSWNFLDIIDF